MLLIMLIVLCAVLVVGLLVGVVTFVSEIKNNAGRNELNRMREYNKAAYVGTGENFNG